MARKKSAPRVANETGLRALVDDVAESNVPRSLNKRLPPGVLEQIEDAARYWISLDRPPELEAVVRAIREKLGIAHLISQGALSNYFHRIVGSSKK